MPLPLSEESFPDFIRLLEISGMCRWSPGQWRNLWEEGRLSSSFVLYVQGKPAGVIACQDLDGEAEILDVFVEAPFRRQGWGGKLLEAVLEKNRGKRRLLLEVDTENLAAVRLYRKCGFKFLYLRKKYYKNGNDAAVYANPL